MTLEYTSNFKETPSANTLFPEIHDILHQTTGVIIENIKSRAIKRDTYYIGSGDKNNAFIHLDLALIEGRPLEMKQALDALLLEYLEAHFEASKKTLNLQITIKIHDVTKNTYFKYPSGSLTPQISSDAQAK
jgi:5-carboxymethyl-2-hydroxymuconate isomerase